MGIQIFKIQPPAISSGSVYLFTSDSGVEYEVRFARKKDNLLRATIAFGVLNEEYEGEEYVETNKGEVYRVMNTIVEIVKMYIKEHPNIRSFEFTGEPARGEDEQNAHKRIFLYRRYVSRIFDEQWNWEMKGNRMIVFRK